MGVFDRIGADDYEQVVFCHDRRSGLRAIIAVHSTRLGPALGGTRFYPYASEAEGLEDVLRLARGMTYKAAAAGLDLGGGKAVIFGDPGRDKTEVLLRAYARHVDAQQAQRLHVYDPDEAGSDDAGPQRAEQGSGHEGGGFGAEHRRAEAHQRRGRRQLGIVPAPLRAYQNHGMCQPRRAGAGLGQGGAGLGGHGVERGDAGHLGQPHPPALHGRFPGHPAQAGQLATGLAGGPADHGPCRQQGHDPVDADLGQLLDRPLRALALDHGEGHGDLGLGARAALDLPRRLQRRPEPARQGAARSVGDGDLIAGPQPEDPLEVVAVVR